MTFACPHSPERQGLQSEAVDVVPVMRPKLPRADQVLPYLHRMDRTGTYANRGPLVEELESRYADYLGVDPGLVAATSNATVGLTGALVAGGTRRWLVPDFTFPAPALAALAAGFSLSLADVSLDDWQLKVPPDHDEVDVGLLPVLPFGTPVDIGRWPSSRAVVVDAAASLGSSRGRLGGLPTRWSVVFSLHATKVLPAGEGGLVVFGDRARADAFKQWCNFGLGADRGSLIPGTNGKMSEVSAAYALTSLDLWETEKLEWATAQGLMTEALRDVDGLSHFSAPGRATPYWIARFDTARRCDASAASLGARQVGFRRWWKPLHAMPAFASCERHGVAASVELARTTLGLPMYRGLSAQDADRVRSALLA